LRLFGRKKWRFFEFPKVVFLSKARKGGFCLHYRKRFLAFSFCFCFSCVVSTSPSFVVFFLLQLRSFVAVQVRVPWIPCVTKRLAFHLSVHIYLLLYNFSWIN
jgi:hypothetical protein